MPCYKQAKTILSNLETIISALNQIKYDYEIIVVIDGNIDQTKETLIKAKLPKIRIISYNSNQGKAFAIRQGFALAQGDYVMFLDAGGEINLDSISMLVEHMDWYDADIVVGSKRHPASQVNYPLKRKIFSQGYYYLTRILFNLKIRDTQAGIKIFNQKVLAKILPRLVEKKFTGDLEMLVVAKKCGFHKICEAPIELIYSDDQFSQAVKLSSVIGIFMDTLAIFYRSNILHYYDRPHHKSRPSAVELEIFN